MQTHEEFRAFFMGGMLGVVVTFIVIVAFGLM